MSDTISVRFPTGTKKAIREVCKELYFSESVSRYVKTCTLENLRLDKEVVSDRVKQREELKKSLVKFTKITDKKEE